MEWLFDPAWGAAAIIIGALVSAKFGGWNAIAGKAKKYLSILKYARNALGSIIDTIENADNRLADGKMSGQELENTVRDLANTVKQIRNQSIIDDTLKGK